MGPNAVDVLTDGIWQERCLKDDGSWAPVGRGNEKRVECIGAFYPFRFGVCGVFCDNTPAHDYLNSIILRTPENPFVTIRTK